MPQNFQINDFGAGWVPSDDDINGRKNGLLQMNNVELDKNGALTLIGGTTVKHTGYTYNAHSLASLLINGARHEYVADTNGAVFRDTTSIITGGSGTKAAFGSAFNFALIASGTKRYKDSGTGTAAVLGVLPPTAAPTVAYDVTNSPRTTVASVQADVVAAVGSYLGISTYVQMTADANGAWILQTYDATPTAVDLNVLTGIGTDPTSYATDNDFIELDGYTPLVGGRSLRLDILLEAGNVSGDPVANYYTYVINDLSTLNFTTTGVFSIRIRRKDFLRVGSGSQDWSTTYGFRLSFAGGASGEIVNILGSNMGSAYFFIVGGDEAQNGQYQYVQVNVNNTGSYIARSVKGPLSEVINLDMGQVLITPQDPTTVDAQCNEAWIYRRGGTLETWYRVKVFTTTGTYAAAYDTLSDAGAQALNIKLNENLISVQSLETILEIVGPMNGRWFYFTTNFIYPSELNNPDLVDASLAIRSTGSNSEFFLWARKIDKATILVGTSQEVYILSGTFATFPDFSIDVYYFPIACKYPPLSYDADVYNGLVFYMSSSGWRTIDSSGNNPLIVAPNTDRLYRNEACYGYTGVNLKIVAGSTRFPVVVNRNKLWCFATGTGRCEVFDFIRKYWKNVAYGLGDVTAACSTQDGQVLGFYGTDKKIREIDIQTSKLIDGATKQTVTLLFPVNDGGYPRQRKDSCTFKARCTTGGADTFTVTITNEINQAVTVGTIASSDVREKYLDLSQLTNLAIVKTYKIGLSGQVADFTLTDMSIDYDLRPVPVSFLRVLGNNYGTTARKRLFSIPFVIDSLGNNVTLVPKVDGINQTSLVVSSTYKKSYDYQFPLLTTDILLGRDYEYTLYSSTGLFEFFGFGEPRNIEILPESRRSLILPVTNFGSPNKKRVRVLPFVLDTLGADLIFTPTVDGVAGTFTTFNTSKRETVLYKFESDAFGIDYGGFFGCATDWEFYERLNPDIVQILPIARHFDQLGPQELFKYGKIKQFEIRVMPFTGSTGTFSSLPYTLYFNDNTIRTGVITVSNMVDKSYFIDVTKGTSGEILRIEIGPTTYDFHRFYMRVQVVISGRDTEMNWITLAGGE